MTRTVKIICAKTPRNRGAVPAIFYREHDYVSGLVRAEGWHCSFCGKRVKVVA